MKRGVLIDVFGFAFLLGVGVALRLPLVPLLDVSSDATDPMVGALRIISSWNPFLTDSPRFGYGRALSYVPLVLGAEEGLSSVAARRAVAQALVAPVTYLSMRLLLSQLEPRVSWVLGPLVGGLLLAVNQDLLQNLGKVLGDDSHPSHEALRKALGGRFQAALIDEFQDTDALQWTLFRTAFGDLDHFLFLIGDPKQAIYGFRGANLAVYKAARAAAGGNRFTMTVNHRSDQRLLEALEHWMGRPGFFGDPDIDFVSVHAPPEHVPDRLRWPQCSRTEPFCAPLQVRFFDKGMSPVAVPGSSIEQLAKGDLNRWLPGRIAADIVGLLDSGAEIKDGEDWRDLGPGDLAVLVRKNREGRGVLRALTQAGVPAVLAGADSVFASDEAVQLQFWLKALAAPNASRAARTAAVSPLSGWQAEHLGRVDAEDPEAMAWWDEWIASLVDWQQGLEKRGLMASFRRLLAYVGPDPKGRTGLERLLSWPDGERRLTNWLHLAELAHQAQVRERLQLSGLLAWLQAERETSSLEKEAVEARLESDAAAVKVLTMHKSKGLQYPVVFAPYLWDGMVFQQGEDAALVVPSDQDPCERVLDLHRDPKAAPKAIHKAVAERERREEALRLLYVALTRARHRVVVYTGAVAGFPNSPLAAALHGDGGSDRLEKGQERSAFKPCSIRLDQVVEALAGSASSDDGTALASVSRCAPLTPVRWAFIVHCDIGTSEWIYVVITGR